MKTKITNLGHTKYLDFLLHVDPKFKQSKQREQVYSGTVWESFAGYSRAVKKGNRIVVSGTTATHKNKVIGGLHWY